MRRQARSSLVLVAFVGTMVTAGAAPASAQRMRAAPDSIVLSTHSRPLVLSPRTSGEFLSLLRASPGGLLHGLVWLPVHPSPGQRAQLRESGITVLASVRGTVYHARVVATADTQRAGLSPMLFAPLRPEDRVAPGLWRGDTARYAVARAGSPRRNEVINADGSANVIVRFHAGTPTAQAEAILRNHAGETRRLSDIRWAVTVPMSRIPSLAAVDAIHWIDAMPVAVGSDTDITRAVVNADAVQSFDVTTGTVGGLGGLGIRVGLFDEGTDETHGDFGSRVIHNSAPKSMHGTHVAGILAGDGTMSTQQDSWNIANGGTPYLWRGLAPQAELLDARNTESFVAANMLLYVTGLGMALSNHSYSFAFDGDYSEGDALHDQMIRGDVTYGGVPIPPRLFVYSTGNHGEAPLVAGHQVGYFSITKQAKNGLVVGNFDAALDRVSPTGSLGPAHDGRIKPDVVAPATAVRSTGYCTAPPASCTSTDPPATSRTGYYFPWTGSSLAAPVATGVLALVLQQLGLNPPESNYPGASLLGAQPLPSTLRAIAVQSARDIDGGPWFVNADGPVRAFPGPDFATGYGMVDAQAAVDVAAGRRMIEGVITGTCQHRTWWLWVEDDAPLSVTLAWDDPPADPLSAHIARKLVNDLDLELIAPRTGQRHFPWLLDQRAVDEAGVVVPDNAQTCDSDVVVERALLPTLTPNYVGPGNAANVNDVVTEALLQPAGRGRDHLNNIEQVRVDDPAHGWWQVRVTGFSVPDAPQTYSIAASRRPVFRYHLVNVCEAWRVLCAAVLQTRLEILCARVPTLCEQIRMPFRADTIPATFRHRSERIVLPLEDVCRFVLACPSCARDGMCPEMDLVFPAIPSELTVTLHDRVGRRIGASAVAPRRQRFRIAGGAGREYALVITPARSARLHTEYAIPVFEVAPQANP